MNKKMLSAVAASAIAFGLIGCGGGSSSSSSNNGSQPTKVKGVDGYVMNPKVTVNYWDKDVNITKSVAVDVSKNYYLTVDAATNKKKAGNPIYSLADLNSTVLNNVVSVVMSSQGQGKLADGSVYSFSFFDADGNGEYNSSIDIPIPSGVSLSAPKGYSVVTPISTIIANQVTAQLSADKNETNLTNVVDAYTKDVANALGVDATTLKNVDPLTLVNSKDEKAQAYVVANAFAGAMIANGDAPAKLFASLKVAKAPKTAADVIGNLATAAKAAGDTTVANVLTQVKTLITTDKANLETLIKSNLDKTRKLSTTNGSLSIAALEGTTKDFNITSMTNYVGGNGYKIATSSLDGINITLDPNDKNITNQKFTFVIRVADPKQFNAQDSNVSSLTVKVPFEVNSTNGNIDAAIPADAKVTFEGMNEAGTKIISGETNSTIFGTNHNPISVSGNTITIKAKTLIDDIDSNQSNAFFGGGLPSDIAEIQAGIVTDSASGVDSAGNYILLPKDSIVSVGGTINETVDSMISFNKEKDLVADMRGGVTRKNADGNASVNYVTSSGNVVGQNQNSFNTLLEVDFNKSSDSNVTLKFADSSIDSSFEKNATLGSVEFNDTLGGALSVNHTSLTNISSTTSKDGVNELNVTVDYAKIDSLSLTGAHPTAMLTFKATDEFYATGAEENATLWFNRHPNKWDTNKTITAIEVNQTDGHSLVAYNNGTAIDINTTTDHNLTNVAFVLSDNDGAGDFVYGTNAGIDGNLSIIATNGCGVTSQTADGNYTIGIGTSTNSQWDVNITLDKLNANHYIIGLQDNNGSVGLKCDLKLRVYDKYKAQSVDKNLTIKVGN